MNTTDNTLVTLMIVILVIIAAVLLIGRPVPFAYHYRYQPAQSYIQRTPSGTTTQTVISYSRPSQPIQSSSYSSTEYSYSYSYPQ